MGQRPRVWKGVGQDGYRLEVDGAQYYDAKWVKKAITRLVLVETLGGIAPPTKQFLHVFAKEAAGTNTDRTVYGAASASASSFVVHHTQQISMAAVAGDTLGSPPLLANPLNSARVLSHLLQP